jgi:hypothetical protein
VGEKEMPIPANLNFENGWALRLMFLYRNWYIQMEWQDTDGFARNLELA